MKTYILQKDLPDIKAGAIFKLDPDKKMYFLAESKVYGYPEKFVESTHEWFKEEEKPMPLGVKPLWLHNEDRLGMIKESIDRYQQGSYAVPEEWIEERKELETYFKIRAMSEIKLQHSYKEPQAFDAHIPKYSESDMRNCFSEARKANCFGGFKHDTFTDYIKKNT